MNFSVYPYIFKRYIQAHDSHLLKYHLDQCIYIIIEMNIPTPAEYKLSRVPDPSLQNTIHRKLGCDYKYKCLTPHRPQRRAVNVISLKQGAIC